MAIDRSDIEKVAHLARLKIEEADIVDVTKSINDILDLVNKMQEVNTDDIEPMAHPTDAVQRLRADQVTEQNQRENFQSVAPAIEDGLYLVPKVID